jgi:hypothetical protein
MDVIRVPDVMPPTITMGWAVAEFCLAEYLGEAAEDGARAGAAGADRAGLRGPRA